VKIFYLLPVFMMLKILYLFSNLKILIYLLRKGNIESHIKKTVENDKNHFILLKILLLKQIEISII